VEIGNGSRWLARSAVFLLCSSSANVFVIVSIA